MVNGVVVLQDKLSLLDRFAKTFFQKNDTNFVQNVLKVLYLRGFKLCDGDGEQYKIFIAF